MAGVLRAVIPAQEFTVAWTHSVEKTRWEERYRLDGERLRLVEARIQGSGAGMDPPPDATFADGWWTWTPSIGPLPALHLTLSPFTRDYDLCWRGRCRSLHRLVASAAAADTSRAATIALVDVRACQERTP
jgi:hypothetical protein